MIDHVDRRADWQAVLHGDEQAGWRTGRQAVGQAYRSSRSVGRSGRLKAAAGWLASWQTEKQAGRHADGQICRQVDGRAGRSARKASAGYDLVAIIIICVQSTLGPTVVRMVCLFLY